jgi:hypothetical protein
MKMAVRRIDGIDVSIGNRPRSMEISFLTLCSTIVYSSHLLFN